MYKGLTDLGHAIVFCFFISLSSTFHVNRYLEIGSRDSAMAISRARDIEILILLSRLHISDNDMESRAREKKLKQNVGCPKSATV